MRRLISKFTAVRDWRLANSVKNEYYGEYAASLALMSARIVAKNAGLMKHRIEDAIGRKVDLVEYDTLKPILKEKILKEQVVLL